MGLYLKKLTTDIFYDTKSGLPYSSVRFLIPVSCKTTFLVGNRISAEVVYYDH
jgi:hypothetical protein